MATDKPGVTAYIITICSESAEAEVALNSGVHCCSLFVSDFFPELCTVEIQLVFVELAPLVMFLRK